MRLLKYLWFLGVVLGAGMIKAAWYDRHEGPPFQILGLIIILASLAIMWELGRLETVAEVKKAIRDMRAEDGNQRE